MRNASILAALCFTLVSLSASAQHQEQYQVEARGGDQAVGDHIRATYKPFDERTRVARNGREDRIFSTRASLEQVLARYHKAYATNAMLPGNIKVEGYFVVRGKRKGTVSFFHAGVSSMMVLHETADGVDMVLIGKRYVKKRIGQQRPFHRGHPPVRTMRYGL